MIISAPGQHSPMIPVPGLRAATVPALLLLLLFTCLPAGAAAPDGCTAGTGAGPAVFLPDPATGEQYVSGQLIVRFDPARFRDAPEMQAYENVVHERTGAQVLREFNTTTLPGLQLLRLPPSLSVADAKAAYADYPGVLYAEPVYRILPVAGSAGLRTDGWSPRQERGGLIPDDPGFPRQWHLLNSGQPTLSGNGTPGADIRAAEAWEVTRGSEDIIAAVMDTGIDDRDPDLAANIWTDPVTGAHGLNVTGGARDYRTGDSAGHGTEVARILGAVTDNGIGTAGTVPEVRLMALKTFTTGYGDTTTDVDAIDAIQYAGAHGASVICIPWTTGVRSRALEDAIGASPALFVTAAGNAGSDNDAVPRYPASYLLPNLIAVAATDNNDRLAPFSNYGKESVDLAAPGTGIPVYACAAPGAPDPLCGYYTMDGTSAAAPQVAGVAVLVKSVDPRRSGAEIRTDLLAGAQPLPSLNGKVSTAGRLDAYSAVLAAVRAADTAGAVPIMSCRNTGRTYGTGLVLPCGWFR
jgi:thermitase